MEEQNIYAFNSSLNWSLDIQQGIEFKAGYEHTVAHPPAIFGFQV